VTPRLWFVLPLLVLTIACGDGNDSLTGPTNTIPNVAGNYSGSTTITFPELNVSTTCPTTTSVTQSGGGNIDIAPLQVRCPEVEPLSLPFGEATIGATGSLGSESGSFSMECGVYNYSGSGGFSGRELRLSLAYVSSTCLNMNITITLTRS
jgi:hypothetical protein